MIRRFVRGVVLALVLATSARPAIVNLTSHAADEASSIGTLSGYDARSRILTIKTAKGAETYALAAKASVYLGSRQLPDEEIASHTGLKVKVRYSESAGKRVANSVMLSPAS